MKNHVQTLNTSDSLTNQLLHGYWRRCLIVVPLAVAWAAVLPLARATCQNGCLSNASTALGDTALANNAGTFNTAIGYFALSGNTSGFDNTASGVSALGSNTTGFQNTAIGAVALVDNTTGFDNTTIRVGTVGTHTNTYIAGINGVTVAGGNGVIVDSNGHLGTTTSSARYKENIQPMDKASEAILSLQPVTFRYLTGELI